MQARAWARQSSSFTMWFDAMPRKWPILKLNHFWLPFGCQACFTNDRVNIVAANKEVRYFLVKNQFWLSWLRGLVVNTSTSCSDGCVLVSPSSLMNHEAIISTYYLHQYCATIPSIYLSNKLLLSLLYVEVLLIGPMTQPQLEKEYHTTFLNAMHVSSYPAKEVSNWHMAINQVCWYLDHWTSDLNFCYFCVN